MRPFNGFSPHFLISLHSEFDEVLDWAVNHPESFAIGVSTILIIIAVIGWLTIWLIRTAFHMLPRLADLLLELLRSLILIFVIPKLPGFLHWRRAKTRHVHHQKEYLRIRPTSDDYDPSVLVTSLEQLHRPPSRARLRPRLNRTSPEPNEIEFIVVNQGPTTGVEFYLGGTIHPDRLASVLPYKLAGFEVETVETNLKSLLNITKGESLPIEPEPPQTGKSASVKQPIANGDGPANGPSNAHPSTTSRRRRLFSSVASTTSIRGAKRPVFNTNIETKSPDPIVFRVGSCGRRSGDWMLSRMGLTDYVTPIDEKRSGPLRTGTHPMLPIIDSLNQIEVPAAVVIRAKPVGGWARKADRRKKHLRQGTDSLSGKVFQFFDTSPSSQHLDSPKSRTQGRGNRVIELSKRDQERVEGLDQSASDVGWRANLWLCGVPVSTESRSKLVRELKSLWEDIRRYETGVYRLKQPTSASIQNFASLLKIRQVLHRQRFHDIIKGRIASPTLGRSWLGLRITWPDFVCTPNELAGLIAIPSIAATTPEVREQIDHRPAHSEPTPQLTPELRKRYTESSESGIRIADLKPRLVGQKIPSIFLSAVEQTRHLIALGATGTGKTTDQAQRAIEAALKTSGPVVLFVGPGANVGSYVVRGLVDAKGESWTEETVHWFKFPEAIPGLTVLDVANLVERHPDLLDRWDAVQQVRDRTLNLLREVMGPDKFDEANYSKQVIDDLIAASFDPEYWYENTGDPFRASKDRCRFSHLPAMMTQMEITAGSNAAIRNRPRSSRKDLDDRLKRYALSDPRSLDAIAKGVHNRLDLIAGNDRRLMLFDNTEERFSFHDAIETDDVYMFDMSSLEAGPQRLMTLILATKLYDALRAGQSKLDDRPDDYVVNLFVDEAAHLIGFQYLSKLLSEGRNYGIGLDLATQFVEQFEQKADLETLLNILNNTHTKIFATHDLDERLARYCRPEGMTISDFQHLVRDMPNSKRVVMLPSQDITERPQSFTAERGSLPPWHPAHPDCSPDSAEFDEFAKSIIRRTNQQFGISDTVRDGVRSGWSQPVLPADLTKKLGLRRPTDIDIAVAIMTAHAQSSSGHRETNGWVPAHQVCDHLVSWTNRSEKIEGRERIREEHADSGLPPHLTSKPEASTSEDYDELLDKISENPDEFVGSLETSIYLECESSEQVESIGSENQSGGKGQQEGFQSEDSKQPYSESNRFEDQPTPKSTLVRLTSQGVSIVEEIDSAGDSGASGSEAHDEMLQSIQRILLENGFEVDIITQGWKSVPDAVAFLPEEESAPELAVEVERSSIKRPDKLLINFQRALNANRVMLTVIEADDPLDGRHPTETAEHIERIFENPFNGYQNGNPQFYNYSHKTISFDGGASSDGATAVRPVGASGDRTTVWFERDGLYVLADGDGTEYATVEDFEMASRKQFPACYTYDRKGENSETGPYAVHMRNGETEFYESKEAFQSEWVTVKRPFVPAYEFPSAGIDRDAFVIVILGEFGPEHEAVIYRNGDLYPIAALREAILSGGSNPLPTRSSESAPTENESEPNNGDAFWSAYSLDGSPITAPPPDIQTKAGGVYHFVAKSLTDDCEDGDNAAIRFKEIHDRYLQDAESNGYPPVEHAPVFSRYLRENLSFTTEKRRKSDGRSRQTWCVGLEWYDSESNSENTSDKSTDD